VTHRTPETAAQPPRGAKCAVSSTAHLSQNETDLHTPPRALRPEDQLSLPLPRLPSGWYLVALGAVLPQSWAPLAFRRLLDGGLCWWWFPSFGEACAARRRYQQARDGLPPITFMVVYGNSL
jgi:hypothetical protein